VIVALALALLGSGCTGTATVHERDIPAYVDEAIEIMAEHGLYSSSSAWADAAAAATRQAESLTSMRAAYALLAKLAPSAGGRHSFFRTPSEAKAAEAISPHAPVPTVETNHGVSILTLPALPAAAGEPFEREYRHAGQEAMERAQTATNCGWVLDVSTNTGGDTYGMLGVVAPLLDAEAPAGFRYRDGTEEWVRMTDPLVGVEGWTAQDPAVPVAIVTGTPTASAAEFVLAAFDGQKDVVRVGRPSAGMTTGNKVFTMSDGAELILSAAWYMNRDGVLIDGALPPDIPVEYGESRSAVTVATEWVASRCPSP
jgi:C-terminal processing protease CtpA/Prc